MRRSTILGVLITLALIVATLFVSSCGEKDVPIITNEAHIIDYLGHVTIAKELFRTGGLFNTTTYTVPFDSAVITERVLDRDRTIDVDVSSGKVDHGVLGVVRDATARVTDRYYLEVTRAYDADTLVDTVEVDLTRDGFFLQLGDYGRTDGGWVLWSVNFPSSTHTITATGSPGGNVRVSGFERLTDIDTVPAGSRLLVATSWPGAADSTYHLLSDYDETGAFTRPMLHYPGDVKSDSLSYATPSSNSRYYNQFMIQILSPMYFPRRWAFAVPYHN